MEILGLEVKKDSKEKCRQVLIDQMAEFRISFGEKEWIFPVYTLN